MKKIILGAILFSGTFVWVFRSCERKQDSGAAPATTLSVINTDPSLSIFSLIASYSGDENYLNNSATMVIPVDSAFVKAGITKKIAARLSPPECDSIVMYYTLFDKLDFDCLPGKMVEFSSGLGPLIYVDSSNNKLFFDGIEAMSSRPVKVGKTSIYKLTQFVNIPLETVTAIASADSSLSFFNEALKRTNFEDRLSDGPYTLFMPTNNAFRNAGYKDIASIDREDIRHLNQILLYQAFQRNFFENQLKKQINLTTLQGRKVQVSSQKRLQFFGNANPNSPACLLNNGMLAENVLTYKINNVLLP